MGNKVTITSPNKDYNGVSAGVRFSDGVAVIDSVSNLAALEYFARHRFGISEDVPSKEADELDVKSQPTPIDVLNAKSVAKLTKPEIEALYVAEGIELGTGTKPELAEALASAVAAKRAANYENPPQVATGPVGPQHNVGRDGADPDAQDPVQTPADVPGI